jgi:hypothetical protein
MTITLFSGTWEYDHEKIESKKSRDTVQFQENPKLSNFELKLVLTNDATVYASLL